jgi:hypothetical protein
MRACIVNVWRPRHEVNSADESSLVNLFVPMKACIVLLKDCSSCVAADEAYRVNPLLLLSRGEYYLNTLQA